MSRSPYEASAGISAQARINGQKIDGVDGSDWLKERNERAQISAIGEVGMFRSNLDSTQKTMSE